MALIEMDDFDSDINLHLFLGFSIAMLVITRWYLLIYEAINDRYLW